MAHVDSGSESFDGTETGRRAQVLVDALVDCAVCFLDPNGIVRSWNAGAQRFKGYSAEEIVGQHFSCFYTEEDRADGMPTRALLAASRDGKYEAEGWRVRKDGSRFWTSVLIDPVFDAAGTLIGFAKVTRDVGERRAAHQALFESEQRFRLLVQGVRDYAIYMLNPQGLVSNWNAGASAIKGYAADEIVGQHFSRFYTEEDRASGEPERALQTALRHGKYATDAWRVRKDGSRFWASVLIDPIRDEGGTLIGFAKITRDISERRKAQEEIDAAREALSQAQKMEAIGRLTGGVAHDFNNLLTVIRGSADILRTPGLSEEKRIRYVEAIAETADRAARLTGQLLAFARRQPLKPESFEVGARIRGMQQIIATTVGSPIALRVDLPEDAGCILADPNQFETAILNVVINAKDAMPAGGRLTLSVRRTAGVPAVRGHAAASGSFIAVTVEDTGTGIDDATLSRIFEPFFTTKGINKGTGLGLSQVYGFAKQSGGEVEVTSTLGQGSTFTLYLPIGQLDRRAAPEAGPGRAVPALAARAVLLVEDNEAVGQFALDLLTELGQSVTWAPHAGAALDLLRDRRADFDVVFSDVVMPGLSGIDLGQEVRRCWPDLPVILTSGYSHVLAEEGSHGFPLVQKPYSITDLAEVLSAAPGRDPGA